MNIFRLGLYAIGLLLGVIFAFKNNPTFPIPEVIPNTSGTTTKVVDVVIAPSFSIHDQANRDLLQRGKALFKQNCAQCHNKNMKDDLTGPALGGIQKRWAGRDTLLYDWIRNSQAVIAGGDAYALDLFNNWNKMTMNAFPNLTDQEIESLLLYIEKTYRGY